MRDSAKSSPSADGDDFVQKSVHKVNCRKMSHARARGHAGPYVTHGERDVLDAIAELIRSSNDGRCFASDRQIAACAGLGGNDSTRRRAVQAALKGWTRRKWNPATGKHDGEPEAFPGLSDPSRGYVEVRGEGPRRELVITEKWWLLEPTLPRSNTQWIKKTRAHTSVPKRSHSRAKLYPGLSFTDAEIDVLEALQLITHHGKYPCAKSDLQIADEGGIAGSDRARRAAVQVALHGRKRRKWNPATGKYDGELETFPGLCDPSRGFVEVRDDGASSGRVLILTAKWMGLQPIRVLDAGDVPAPPAAEIPADAPAVAPAELVSLAPPATAAAPGLVAPAAPVTDQAAEPVISPPDESVCEVLGERYVGRSRIDQAEWLFQRLDARGLRLILRNDGTPGRNPDVPPAFGYYTEHENTLINSLIPELVAKLRPKIGGVLADPLAVAQAGTDRRAAHLPAVDRGVINEVRGIIARLAAAGAERPRRDMAGAGALSPAEIAALSDKAAKLMSGPTCFRDANEEDSQTSYRGRLMNLGNGDPRHSQALIEEAFLAACGKLKDQYTRGQVFTRRVNDGVNGSHSRKGAG